MKNIFLENGIMDKAKLLKLDHENSESTLFVKNDILIKLYSSGYNDENRCRTLYSLNDYNNPLCSLPIDIIVSKKDGFSGFTQPYYDSYKALSEIIEDRELSFKDRLNIAKTISSLIESFNSNKFAYFDLHSQNILAKKTDIMLIDMDSVIYRSIHGELEYHSSLSTSCKYLTSLILSLLYGIDVLNFTEISQKNRKMLLDRCNYAQGKILEYSINDPYTIFFPTDYIDDFTEEFIKETKPELIRTL